MPNEHIGNRTHDFLAVPQPTAPPRNAVFQTSLAKSNMSGYWSHCSTIFLSYFCSGCGMMANRVQKRRQLLNFCIKVMTKNDVPKYDVGVIIFATYFRYLLAPWSRVLLEKVNSPHFMEQPESSLPYSQATVTCPYPEPTPSSPHNPFPLPEDPS